MNRVLFALAVGVLGLGMMGCATSVDDPLPPLPAPEVQHDPPQQALSGKLRQPQLQETTTIDNTSLTDPEARQLPPIPAPTPMAKER